VSVQDPAKVDRNKLKAMGAAEVLQVGNSEQAIFGTASENLKTDMEIYLKTADPEADVAPAPAAPSAKAPTPVATAPTEPEKKQAGLISAALGGWKNIKTLDAVAATRLRVRLTDDAKVDAKALEAGGVKAVMALPDGEQDLIVGMEAGLLAQALTSSKENPT
jgi:PTS system glucose-specific IIC component